MSNKNAEKKSMSGNQKALSVPEGFTPAMAFVDCLPVLFFSISSVTLALRFDSSLFRVGILLVILAGALKAGWKFTIAFLHRDIPFLSRQMRFLMPAGFLLVLAALFIDRRKWSLEAVFRHMTKMPALGFFICGAAGLLFLSWLAKSQNNRDAKTNWKEQIVNSLSQFCIMLGILL